MSILRQVWHGLRKRRVNPEMLRDVRAFCPGDARLASEIAAARRDLAAAHGTYTSSVSSPDMAVSLETASYLLAACRIMQPASILDLGSGFSSYTLRTYARDAKVACAVTTVDDEPAWLERSREFLHAQGLDARGLATWQDFAAGARAAYDFVFHDLGRMPVRTETLERVLPLVATDGLAVLDDVHKPPYAAHAREVCERLGFEIVSLEALTLDRYGRYAWLAFRTGARPPR